MNPLHITEFTSDRYFSKLRQLNENSENASSSSSVVPTAVSATPPSQPSSTLTLPFGNPRLLDSNAFPASPGIRNGKKKSLGHDLTALRVERRTSSNSSFVHKNPSIVKYHESISDITYRDSLNNSILGNLLLRLPIELQVQIISPLPIHTILNLRLVSRSFHALITENESPIVLFHVEHSLPTYALRLYPIPQATKINLNYFCGIWHRLHVAEKLSTAVSRQAAKEIFLRRTDSQWMEFEPQYRRMCQRLTPRIFTLNHFFETYRDLHLQHLMENGTPLRFQPFTLNPIEARIISSYDNDTLLAVHEVFPLIVSSFSRCLRPPSYAGRLERSIRGYLKDRPADKIYTTILTIGGLRQALRFWEVDRYNVRRAAVDAWYGHVSRSPPPSKSLPESKLSILRRLRGKKSAPDAERKHDETTGCSEWYCVKDTCRAHQRLLSTPGLLDSSLTAGPPMGPLSLNQLQLLLPDLPHLSNIWIHTAEALILERKIVERSQDIKRPTQALLDLIKDDGTPPVRAVSFGNQEEANASTAAESTIQEPEMTDNVESDASNFPTVLTANQPASPHPSLESISENIATIFWANDDLKGLFRETSATSRKITWDWCEESFMLSWIQACERLSYNNSDSLIKANTRVLRRMSRYVAHSVRAKAVSQNVQSVEPHAEISTEKSANSNSDITRKLSISKNINSEKQQHLEHQDSEMDDKELPVDLSQLITFIETLGLYQTIIDIFRLSMHGDTVEEAILGIWPVCHPRSSAYAVEFEIQWEILEYLKTYFSLTQQLGDVLTITGDCVTTGEAFNAQAISCRDYLSATWPAIASSLVEGLGSILHTSHVVFIRKESFEFEIQQKSAGSQGPLESSAYMKITATYELQLQFANALSWVIAAIRHSPHEGLASSRTMVGPSSSGTGVISLAPGELRPFSETISCWPSLFQNAVIAEGYPIPARSQGKGLEISFVDMTNLARSLAFVEVDGGLVLDGLVTVLFPVKQLRKDNAIQWHLEMKPERSEDDISNLGTHPSEVMASCRPQSWDTELDAEKLATTRVFLGWAEKAQVVLGTDSSFAMNVEVSGAFDSNPTRPLKTFGGSAGVSLLGFANFSATASTTRSAVSSGISGIKNTELKAMKQNLKNGVENHVIIYDDDQDTGWLISYTTLVLFLTQIYLLRQSDPQSTLPAGLYASTAHDGGESARKTINDITATTGKTLLNSNDGTSRFDGISNSDLSPDSLADLIKVTWHRLSLIQDELRKIYTDARKSGEVAPELILGVELMDVALREESMPVKRAKVDNAWAHLAEHQPCMVLFCKNLGQAIVPSLTAGLCAEWSSVPVGKKYLAATGPSVVHMLKKRTRKGISRLGDHISWNFKSQIIELHQPGLRTRCSHVQYLRSEEPSDDHSGLLDAVKAYESGGYIFGSLFPLQKQTKRMALASNIPTLKKSSSEPQNSNATIPIRLKTERYRQTLPQQPLQNRCSEDGNLGRITQSSHPKMQDFLSHDPEDRTDTSSIDDNSTFPNGNDESACQNKHHKLTQSLKTRWIENSDKRLRRMKGREQLVCDTEAQRLQTFSISNNFRTEI